MFCNGILVRDTLQHSVLPVPQARRSKTNQRIPIAVHLSAVGRQQREGVSACDPLVQRSLLSLSRCGGRFRWWNLTNLVVPAAPDSRLLELALIPFETHVLPRTL